MGAKEQGQKHRSNLPSREGRVNERPRGGRNNVRVDNEIRDCINEILNENCLLTLQQINEELRRRLPTKPLVCDGTIGKTMDGMLISEFGKTYLSSSFKSTWQKCDNLFGCIADKWPCLPHSSYWWDEQATFQRCFGRSLKTSYSRQPNLLGV